MEEHNNKPVVHLISKPENMLKTIYTAARTCYNSFGETRGSYENPTDYNQLFTISINGKDIFCFSFIKYEITNYINGLKNIPQYN